LVINRNAATRGILRARQENPRPDHGLPIAPSVRLLSMLASAICRNFNRTFRRHYGATPGEIRQSALKLDRTRR
jgi:hypothetical protein